MLRTLQACALGLVACAVREPAPQVTETPPKPYVAPVAEPLVYEHHGEQPLSWREEHPAVEHLDPNRCQDPRIARVLSKCSRHGDPPMRIWFTCPRSEFNYDDRRYAEIEMNNLWYDCSLQSDKPSVPAPKCDGGVLRGEITQHRGQPVQPREMEIDCDM